MISVAMLSKRPLPLAASYQEKSQDKSYHRLHLQGCDDGEHGPMIGLVAQPSCYLDPYYLDPWFFHREIWKILEMNRVKVQIDCTHIGDNLTVGALSVEHAGETCYNNRSTTKVLEILDLDIPRRVQRRFRKLRELFAALLREHMTYKCSSVWVSIHLRSFGAIGARAKPCIVVVCRKTASRDIGRLFDQQHVRSEYQPPDDSSRPPFDVYVCYLPPRV